MKFPFHGSHREIAVLFFHEKGVRGILLCRENEKFRIKRFLSESVETLTELPLLCRKIFREMGGRTEALRILTGGLPSGIFFRCRTARMSPKNLRSALTLEVPMHWPERDREPVFQFAECGETGLENELFVNVYPFSETDRDRLLSFVSQGIRKADCFFYPLLALRPEYPPVRIPELEKDFCFRDGEWRPAPEAGEDWLESWKEVFQPYFLLPDDSEFSLELYFPCLLAALPAVREDSDRIRAETELLPRSLHPGRYRTQLLLTGILTVLLGITLFWDRAKELDASRRAEESLIRENRRLAVRIRESKIRIKRAEKEQRDMTRVLNASAGESDLLGKLYRFSTLLPDNVLVTGFRLNESGIDIQLRSEAETLNLQSLLKEIPGWKIASNRQFRRSSDMPAMIFLKIVPSEGENWR